MRYIILFLSLKNIVVNLSIILILLHLDNASKFKPVEKLVKYNRSKNYFHLDSLSNILRLPYKYALI